MKMSSNVVNCIDLPVLTGAADTAGPALGERLDLVGHVKIKLSISLGGAEITIGKLFSLTPDDVITLDRSVDAPLDIVLNDKVIAHGALVAVGDNFGVRVTQVQRES
jgi:flagellar motor switch protein FliN/FliY